MLPWLRLMRLPNLATAAADSLAGYLVVSGLQAVQWPPAACLLAVLASLGFYAAGMVLNDVYDVAIDRAERPERPLPSGAIAVRRAAAVGNLLMAVGAAAACGAAFVANTPWPAFVGATLTVAIWLYDRHAKATPLGPAVMGACRGLNWLLGMTAVGGPTAVHQWAIPLGMAIYVAGAVTMAVGLAVAAGFVWLPLRDGVARVATLPAPTWLMLWGILSASVILRAIQAVASPSIPRVRAAVGNAIMAIITLDAVLVLAACGERWAIVVICLLAWFLLGRRLVPPT